MTGCGFPYFLSMNPRPLHCSAVTIALIFLLAGTVCAVNAYPQSTRKEIAVTFDDLPLNGPQLELARLQIMTRRLLAGIESNHLPVIGFVNESLLYVPGETDARIALLKAWSNAGVELGNHTFGHLGFKDTPLADYEDDFVRGETVIRTILQQRGLKPAYFRHPYLQMGPTKELEESFETFIGARGYRIAPVTIDIMDWMFRAAYTNARNRGDLSMTKEIADDYLRFADIKVRFCEKVAAELFGRSIKHILLLHANELNADNFNRLIAVFRNRGYEFISLSEALKDPAYRYPDQYTATSDWLSQWSHSKGKQFEAPMPPESIRKTYSESMQTGRPE